MFSSPTIRQIFPAASSSRSSLLGRRCLSTSKKCRAEFQAAPEPDAETQAQRRPPRGRVQEVSYTKWLETVGEQYKNPRRQETNWLGGRIPFPLNLSFRPAPPMSNALRGVIFESYRQDPTTNTARAISGRYGISIARVEAIIRLKTLEASWKESRPLQTDFCEVMESHLGVQRGSNDGDLMASLEQRSNAMEVDGLAEESASRESVKVTRMYWELVDENKEPVVAPLLEAKRATVSKKAAAPAQRPVRIVTTSKGSNIAFIDVGKKFTSTRAKR